MFMMFDPLYFLILAPGLLLAAWAQFRVKSAFHQGKQYRASSNISGAEAAAEVMQAAGVHGVTIEQVGGHMTDHYDPRHKVLRLSPEVFSGRSLSALGVAAHEAGHAVQDATKYPLLSLRNAIVPIAGIGSSMAMVLFMIGMFLLMMRSTLGQPVMILGILGFSAVVLFQLVNLPVEFDASKRARAMLINHGLVTEQEDVIVKKVLGAAAMTYVAATLTAVLTLLYFLIRSGVLGGSSSRD